MSDTVKSGDQVLGRPGTDGGGGMGNGGRRLVVGSLGLFARQREATVLVVTVALLLYFGLTHASTFVSQTNAVDLLSELMAPIAIIAIGEVLLLICGEIDLSVGFIYTLAPIVTLFAINDYHVPALLAVILGLLSGLVAGWVNGFITVTLGVPSFITTIGTGFILGGIALTVTHAEPSPSPPIALGVGKWLGVPGNPWQWAPFAWAVVLVAIFHVVLTRTRWGLYTISAGGNLLGAREAGINVGRIKYGNFMITGFMGALVGLQTAFYTNNVDPSAGGYSPMFYAVIAAVIGGTAMLGGSGTIFGAFLGAIVLATLTDGFDILGVSANPLGIIFGGAILVAMIANVQLARLRGAGRSI
ncbi:MAG TPA: ABC transporter permease [Streptosporangiaceae bacterium]|nr:ABC transporter permease [Streptosporangiaceae bacterium]